MGYSDIKVIATDLTKAALNGSPYWRVLVTACVFTLSGVAVWGYLNLARSNEVSQQINSAIAPLQSDIEAIKERQKKDATNDVTTSIFNAKRDQCDATRDGRNARAWTERIQSLMTDYYLLTGKAFEMPTCQEV